MNQSTARFAYERGMPMASATPTACSMCYMQRRCLFSRVPAQYTRTPHPRLAAGRSYSRGERIYTQGEAAPAIYTVRTGSVKTMTATSSGVEQVMGFHLPADPLGLDALPSGFHTSSAVALEPVSICALSSAQVESLCMIDGELLHRLLGVMASESKTQGDLRILTSHSSAIQRVASFLVDLSWRMGSKSHPSTELHLRMSRHDIASYLGITPETVSRVLSRLSAQGAVTVAHRHVRIDAFGLLMEHVDDEYEANHCDDAGTRMRGVRSM